VKGNHRVEVILLYPFTSLFLKMNFAIWFDRLLVWEEMSSEKK
jgi:hypothetical protein